MSIEEQVEEYFKKQLDGYHLRHYGKTEAINDAVAHALKNANSKSGCDGNNYPDIRLLLTNETRRSIPVMIEAKGAKNKLERLDADNQIDMSKPSYIQGYAVNGALHYGNAILAEGTYSEVIIVGINGTEIDPVTGIVKDPELKAYYVAKKNSDMPKHIPDFDFIRCMPSNLDALFDELDTMSLSDAEREQLKRQTEQTLEERVKAIHQSIYDDPKLRVMLDTNGKLYLFCGLIMAGMPIAGAADLSPNDLTSNTTSKINDGTLIMDRIEMFLESRESTQDKVNMVRSLFQPTFSTEGLWRPDEGGISILHTLYKQIKEEIIPLFKEGINLDFTGKILNSLSDWASISDDAKNDVVLTPRYVTKMMAIMARTNMDSLVWDSAMGSAGFLVSAMDLMIRDAEIHIHDKAELQKKIKNIKQHQLLGIEILGPVFVLAVLNMILMGDGSSQIVRGDSHAKIREGLVNTFPATVFLLNPPYSSSGKGFVFVEEALNKMTTGYACILIQENAGSGQGLPYTKRILEHNTLLASIHMPTDLFGGKASVQAAIYVFKVAQPHDADNMVTFIDMSEDGYSRQNRKKSSQAVNLKDTDHAEDRYAEVEAIVLGKMPKTHYYTEANGKVIRDTISLNGDDWTFNQHKKIDTTPTEEDFKKTVADYLAWKVGAILKGEVMTDV
jgi:type I restriction enzyme M protein